MLSTTTKKVGAATYVISKMPATKAMRVHLALGKAILEALSGPSGEPTSLGALAGGAGAPEAIGSEEQAKVLTLVVRLFTALPADDWTAPDGRRYTGFESLCRLLLEHAKFEGKTEVDPDVHFEKVGDVYLLMWEVLKHNFADFLGDVLSRSRQHAAKPAA